MIILEDMGNKVGQHIVKNKYFEKNGIGVIRAPLPVGDYILMNDRVQNAIDRKKKRGIELKKMDFLGTYNIAVDSKRDIQELVGNICGKSHERFRDECILAQNNGIKLYIMVEDSGGYVDRKKTIWNKPVRSLEDLLVWKNPRAFVWVKGVQKNPTATKGETLAKACLTMQKKYGVEFLFTTPQEAGKKIIELLGVNGDG